MSAGSPELSIGRFPFGFFTRPVPGYTAGFPIVFQVCLCAGCRTLCLPAIWFPVHGYLRGARSVLSGWIPPSQGYTMLQTSMSEKTLRTNVLQYLRDGQYLDRSTATLHMTLAAFDSSSSTFGHFELRVDRQEGGTFTAQASLHAFAARARARTLCNWSTIVDFAAIAAIIMEAVLAVRFARNPIVDASHEVRPSSRPCLCAWSCRCSLSLHDASSTCRCGGCTQQALERFPYVPTHCVRARCRLQRLSPLRSTPRHGCSAGAVQLRLRLQLRTLCSPCPRSL